MKIHFYSKVDSNIVQYYSEGYYEDDKIIFTDKSVENTNVELKCMTDQIIINRIGSTNMCLNFILNEKTCGIYQDALGLEFEYQVLCKKMSNKNNKIDIEYDYFIDGIYETSVHIWIILLQNA